VPASAGKAAPAKGAAPAPAKVAKPALAAPVPAPKPATKSKPAVATKSPEDKAAPVAVTAAPKKKAAAAAAAPSNSRRSATTTPHTPTPPASATAARAVSKDQPVTKPAPAKASAAKAEPKPEPSKPAFDKKFLDEQRIMLNEERAKYLHSAQMLKAEADALVFEREPGDVQFDEESGEGDTLAVERDFDLARSAQANQQVDEIDAALARIDAGTYGICRVSGQPIPKERLRAIPWATERVEYKVGGLGRR
jgi:RNA polymerase-binding transcription factor DksA